MAGDDAVMLLRLQRAYDTGAGHRSSVRRWMQDNHEALASLFGDDRVDWVWLTAWFTENGFRNADGSALKKETVRKIWSRVNRTVEGDGNVSVTAVAGGSAVLRGSACRAAEGAQAEAEGSGSRSGTPVVTDGSEVAEAQAPSDLTD